MQDCVSVADLEISLGHAELKVLGGKELLMLSYREQVLLTS